MVLAHGPQITASGSASVARAIRRSRGNVPLQNFPVSKVVVFRDKYFPKRRQSIRNIPPARPPPIPCTVSTNLCRSHKYLAIFPGNTHSLVQAVLTFGISPCPAEMAPALPRTSEMPRPRDPHIRRAGRLTCRRYRRHPGTPVRPSRSPPRLLRRLHPGDRRQRRQFRALTPHRGRRGFPVSTTRRSLLAIREFWSERGS